MSAQSFAEKGVQKCPFCPCGNMCTCSVAASSECEGSDAVNVERNIRLVAMSAAVLRSGLTMKRQKDAEGMCLLWNDRSD